LFERSTGDLVGVVNVTEIVRGALQGAYLGYYLFRPFGGLGYMTDGLRVVIDRAFGELALHRLEANIQPDNERSIRLVKRLGFRREGLSPRYLKVGGRWRGRMRLRRTISLPSPLQEINTDSVRVRHREETGLRR
jgi:ribosomal-protein-alanine N-acetyltransferase